MPAGQDTLDAIRQALAAGSVQADVALYNEANQLVANGRYEEARRRLDALLALFPHDGQAWLLRGKVLVATHRWKDALDALDAAEAAGAAAPDGLRNTLQERLAAEARPGPASESAPASPDVEALRAQLRHARSQNQILVAANRKLERDTNWWAIMAAGIGVITISLVVVQLRMLPSTSSVAEGEPVAVVDDAGEEPPSTSSTSNSSAAATTGSTASTGSTGSTEAATETPPPTPAAPVRDPGLAEVAARALAEADADNGGALRVTVRGSTATLTGKAATHAQINRAIEALQALSAIDTVDADAVINLARRDGTTYVVSSGDSLSRIAYRHYGDQSLSNVILEANPQLGGRTNLQIGDRLNIPPVKD